MIIHPPRGQTRGKSCGQKLLFPPHPQQMLNEESIRVHQHLKMNKATPIIRGCVQLRGKHPLVKKSEYESEDAALRI